MGAKLVPLHGRVNGHADAQPVMWVNPEHIVSVTPKFVGSAPAIDLHVGVKLVGVPLHDSWLGRFTTVDTADTRWGEFLDSLTG